MNGLETLVLAATTFVGLHLLMSWAPVRGARAGRLKEGGFLGLYALISLVSFAWMVMAFRNAPAQARLWTVGSALWATASGLTLIAAILLVGSFLGNPALPDPTGRLKAPQATRGAFVITRHPMNFAVALWALGHILVSPTPKGLVLAGALLGLAVVGSAHQDRRKALFKPDVWTDWEARTGFWPFAALLRGRARLSDLGWRIPLAGSALWLAATWAHGGL
ncbi:MAG: MFS transporter, partial [Alphaproteobacteria bacterium]|nr:MFS transporter [Alphaproteobacteria bacterium]